MTASVVDRAQRAELAKAARREEILGAARRVFAERGFRGTTIADIAEEAKIALGTIYLYFSSKEDVFAALNQRFNEVIMQATRDIPVGRTVAETTRRYVESVFQACAENRDLIRLVVLNTDPESDVAKRMRKADTDRNRPLTTALRRGMQAGTVREGVPGIMANLVRGAVSMAVYQAFVVSDGTDAQQYRDACGDMLSAYLTPSA
ncbi:MAG: helix-turn-helix domain-containing protein [Dehalococcoidia bacterium]